MRVQASALALGLLVVNVGCSNGDAHQPHVDSYTESSHALVIDVGATQLMVGIDPTPQHVATSVTAPTNAEALVAGAAAECGVALPTASQARTGPTDEPVRRSPFSPRLVRIGIDIFPQTPERARSAPFFGGGDQPSCDEVTEQVEALVCVASKLNDLGDAVGRTEWRLVTHANAELLAPEARNASRTDPWSIRPPADRDRFIARDLALHALAVAARVDATPLTLPSGEAATCTQIYAAVAGLGGASLPQALAGRAFAADAASEDYLPG